MGGDGQRVRARLDFRRPGLHEFPQGLSLGVGAFLSGVGHAVHRQFDAGHPLGILDDADNLDLLAHL
jgi:hypothetical protein